MPSELGFLIELHCVLEPVLHRCSSYRTDRGTVLLWIFMSVAYPSIQHRVSASGSRRARPRWAMTPSAPIDERCGITSQARNQPLAPFWILFRPGFGYYCPNGEARKTAVFLGLNFQREFESISLQRRVRVSHRPGRCRVEQYRHQRTARTVSDPEIAELK
jgi:hypothetical protein